MKRSIIAALVPVAAVLACAGCAQEIPASSEIVEMPADKGGLVAEESCYDEGYAYSTDCYPMPEPLPEPMPDYNTEEYSARDESGFVSPTANPLSTVSADVDTASYCNLRRMADEGYAVDQIPSGAVRIEEMLNYFSYGYPQPTGDDRFSITATAGPCPWNDDTQLLILGFNAASPEANDKGRNLVFLIDVSGSMDEPYKLPLLQSSLEKLIMGLGPDDRISIVTYSGEESIVLEGAPGNEHRTISQTVESLYADGSTNGEAGLRMAYDVAERNKIEGGVNRIIMCSDGDLNVGMTSESELHDFVDAKRQTGIYLSVLGFGSGNYKDNKMETLADHGNGSYHYIDCLYEAQRVFDQNLLANIEPFADDVRFQIEFNPAKVKGYRLIGYENREMSDEDFRNDEADAGDVGPGSQFTVAYEVALADSALDIPESELKYGTMTRPAGDHGNEWLTCTLRYHPFGQDGFAEQELVVDDRNWSSDPVAGWKFAAAVIETGMALGGSDYAGTSSLDSALALLGSIELDGDRADLHDLIEAFKSNRGYELYEVVNY